MGEANFLMDNEEISVNFRTAANPQKQVQILADLNCVSKYEMGKKLYELGLLEAPPTPAAVAAPAKPREKAPRLQKPKRWDVEHALSLYKAGLTDLEIADSVGVTKSTIGVWRRENLFPPNVKVRPTPNAAPPKIVGMTVSRLRQLLDDLVVGHPDALVFAAGSGVIGVDVLVCMDVDGKTQSSRISFRTEG